MDKSAVLIVEDSFLIREAVADNVRQELGFETLCAQTLAEAADLLDSNGDRIFAAVLDLCLPDAPAGEVVDMVLAWNVPSIVLTGSMSVDVRKQILSRGVVDYVLKDKGFCFEYLRFVLRRLHRSSGSTVLLVDDSESQRLICQRCLQSYAFTIRQTGSSQEALQIVENDPSIQLAIIDYTMPGMNGVELTTEIRRRRRKHEMSIIGMSSSDESYVVAEFLKHGADDFLKKPFQQEEFYCRVLQNLELMDTMAELRRAAHRDHLTGLFNRHFLFDVGTGVFERKQHEGADAVLAMVDVDHFKTINDTHGHEAGDRALKHLARLLESFFRKTDFLVRLGGEEFCIYLPESPLAKAQETLEQILHEVAAKPVEYNGTRIPMTVSIGVAHGAAESLDELIRRADKELYVCKENGRNQLRIEADPD